MESDHFRRALARIYRGLMLLATAGAAAVWWNFGWKSAAGFLAGALFALLNLRWLDQLVETVVREDAGKPKRRLVFWLSVRYLVFAAGAYVMMRFLGVSLLAPLAGMLMAAGAVVLEILYELILYART
jgi:hypothetical protein